MTIWKRKSEGSKEARRVSSPKAARPLTVQHTDREIASFEPVPFDPNDGLPPQVVAKEEQRTESLYVCAAETENSVAPSAQSRAPVVELHTESFIPSTKSAVTENGLEENSEELPEEKSVSADAEASKPAIQPAEQFKSKLGFKARRASRSAARGNKKKQDSAQYLDAWHKGSKGRPTEIFIGFLPDVSKKDALSFAIGVANKHCTNITNTAYAVYKYSSGWAYEVHEGGPRRAYLPKILDKFAEQAGGPIHEEDAVVIETAQRRVRIERTQTGLTAFLMPESFTAEQTSWLEPGPKLKPVVSLRVWLIGLGALLFVTGFITLVTTLATRPTPPPLNAPARRALPYASLPISQWHPMVATYDRGSAISALRFRHNQWFIQTQRTASAPSKSSEISKVVTPKSNRK